MSDKKLIKGLKKIIKELKPFNDQKLEMDSYDDCAIGILKLWHMDEDYSVPDQQKTAKKLFGIKSQDDVFSYSFGHYCTPDPKLTENQLKVLKLFDHTQFDIKVKKWRKHAKLVLKEIVENSNEM